MLFLRLAPNPAGRKRQKASCGGRFVCGKLDASRQGDGGQTVLSSVEIEDGVYGTCGWVDYPTGTPYHTADNPKPDQPRPANPAVGDSYLTYPLDPVHPTSESKDKRWEQTTRYTNNVSGYDPSSNWNFNGVCWSDWRYYPNNDPNNDTKRWRLEFNHTQYGGDYDGDDDNYWYDKVWQELRNYTIYNQNEVEHTYRSYGRNPNYILDNLVVADVGSLASIAIPDIPGVDAHGCGLAGRGAAMSIGGRDYLSQLYADWGNTRHLCLYGNGISFEENGETFYTCPSYEFKIGCGIPDDIAMVKGGVGHNGFITYTDSYPGFRLCIKIGSKPEEQFYSTNSGWVGTCTWYEYDSEELHKSQMKGEDWHGGEKVITRMQTWGPGGPAASWTGNTRYSKLQVWPFGK